MAKRREAIKHRRVGRFKQRGLRQKWMARIILLGMTAMLALSITLTLWPPMPPVDNGGTSAPPSSHTVTLGASVMPQADFPEGSPPPGLRMSEEGQPPDAGEPPPDQEGPAGPFDDQHLDLLHNYGWRPPGAGQQPGGEEPPPEGMGGPPEGPPPQGEPPSQ